MPCIEIIIATESLNLYECTPVCFWNLQATYPRYSMYSDNFIIREIWSRGANSWLARTLVQHRG